MVMIIFMQTSGVLRKTAVFAEHHGLTFIELNSSETLRAKNNNVRFSAPVKQCSTVTWYMHTARTITMPLRIPPCPYVAKACNGTLCHQL